MRLLRQIRNKEKLFRWIKKLKLFRTLFHSNGLGSKRLLDMIGYIFRLQWIIGLTLYLRT